jgi:hypothetical protein
MYYRLPHVGCIIGILDFPYVNIPTSVAHVGRIIGISGQSAASDDTALSYVMSVDQSLQTVIIRVIRLIPLWNMQLQHVG